MRRALLLLILAACSKPQPPAPADPLLDPKLHAATAPEEFRVRVETTQGTFVIRVVRSWAPRGADRFYNLVQAGFYDGCRFFRVVDNPAIAQFGMHGDPKVSAAWSRATFPDDAGTKGNARGTVAFATRGPNERTTQLFINRKDNPGLDGRGFAPIGEIVEGLDVVDALYSGYGEGADSGGRGPYQSRILREGNAYLEKDYPKLDYIRTARLAAMAGG